VNPLLTYLACGAISYLLGAVPFGYLIARARGVDITSVGSGNIGATNVFRSVGKGWGLLTFALDAGKGFVAACAIPKAAALAGQPAGPALPVCCACLAVAGHNWPIYMRFKGGKGIATSAGALLGIAPQAAGIGIVSWALVFLLTRYVSVASIFACLILPAAAWCLYGKHDKLLPAALTLLGVVGIWRHRSNIQRLLNGTEHRAQFGRRKS
jgi:acyl phosphate:glycerol-3-phosphate acyltransferase